MIKVLAVGLVVPLCLVACTSQQGREERDRADLSKRINEICSLPPAGRDAALERLKKESGLVLVCGTETHE